MTNWKRKLAAYLHDPPEKAYDFGPNHKKQAAAYLNLVFGPGQLVDRQPDWAAAAADRFIFPDGQKLHALGLPGLGGGIQFIHPLSGNSAFSPTDFPAQEDAGDIISQVLPSFAEPNAGGGADLPTQFWLLWRAWLHFAVTHHHGQKQGADKLAYLPADTRVPDGTIWHHNAIVSALEAARLPDSQFAPAFLLFQIGPVQDFIAQARSTRDLWSGSYLLSWMMAHAMQIITDRLGPDCIVFPSLRGQPLHDWLNHTKLQAAKYAKEGKSFWETLGLAKSQDLVLTPNLPNRFLAIVPEDFKPEQLVAVFDYGPDDQPRDQWSEWRRICEACWKYLNCRAQLCPPDQENVKLRLWRFQCRHFWQVSWQLWPWPNVATALDLFKATPLGEEAAIHLSKDVAYNIPKAHQDERNYRENNLNPGWAWSANYQLLAHRLDARRQTRDFAAWQGEPGAPKDHLSGKEEIIADREEWLPSAQANPELKHRFRKNDELGAVNLIKRIWDKAYLEQQNLTRARTSFDSVPAVAAASFAAWLRELTASGPLREPFLAFMRAASAARAHFPDSIASWESDEEAWFRNTDASVFHLSVWDDAIADAADDKAKQLLSSGRDALAKLLKAAGARPSTYYAVLALDGDEIGKWLSGEKTPEIQQVLTVQAADYFRQHVKTADTEKWLASPRPLSPSYHLQFSEALASFGLYAARRIIEAHHGQLIYSGGDDVLAMLPADQAIACARGLRLAFQGKSKELAQHDNRRYAHLFADDVPEGFIKLKDGERNRGCRRDAEPSWPLLVPGPRATVSVGLAIGHMREPLQDMVREAQAAEKRAKAPPQREVFGRQKNTPVWKLNEGWGRDALAVTLFKRSGETIRWGAKFDSPAFALLELFQRHYRVPLGNPKQEMPISGKFPYRVAELLGKFDASGPLTDDLCNIAAAEFAWITQQQIRQIGPFQPEATLHGLREELLKKATDYLDYLHKFQWEQPTANGERQRVTAPRPLREFIHLFALEAFIARTGE